MAVVVAVVVVVVAAAAVVIAVAAAVGVGVGVGVARTRRRKGRSRSRSRSGARRYGGSLETSCRDWIQSLGLRAAAANASKSGNEWIRGTRALGKSLEFGLDACRGFGFWVWASRFRDAGLGLDCQWDFAKPLMPHPRTLGVLSNKMGAEVEVFGDMAKKKHDYHPEKFHVEQDFTAGHMKEQLFEPNTRA